MKDPNMVPASSYDWGHASPKDDFFSTVLDSNRVNYLLGYFIKFNCQVYVALCVESDDMFVAVFHFNASCGIPWPNLYLLC